MADFLLLILMVVFGIVLLLAGGDLLVRGATALARRLGVPALVIGLTVVAFGTSAPEMVVSVAAAIQGAPGLAYGNIVGSNIANILLVLGIPAILAPLVTRAPGVRTNTAIALVLTIVFIAMGLDGEFGLREGWVLFGAILVYTIWLGYSASRPKAVADPLLSEMTDVDSMEGLPRSAGMVALFTIGGLVLLPLGAHFVVSGGGELARQMGVSEAVIGLTLLAVGTSLPELSTALIAALRKQAAMAFGNIIGSNIFNICAVGGITGIAAHMAGASSVVDDTFLRLDFWVMGAAMLIGAAFVFAKRPIGRASGVILSVCYAAYIAALLATNL
ncbi:calcium/sodium antiporter [Alkalicaulis satelles]|uniref:Calcium/sodium antiporter n=1 Tax=Alkalicaulis satelles TaxID=2609175 RepID=A0A5M6ZFJ9_9PROT|nr:calcium/sodium antiporter [Alkalicaulis satelles]KAA5803516.1 calcium/sodium antiporter [Alkalicaulis satelles]